MPTYTKVFVADYGIVVTFKPHWKSKHICTYFLSYLYNFDFDSIFVEYIVLFISLIATFSAAVYCAITAFRICIFILIICTSFSQEYKQSSIKYALHKQISLLYVPVLVRNTSNPDRYHYYMYHFCQKKQSSIECALDR